MSTDSLYALRSAARQGLGACAGSAWLMAQDVAEGRWFTWRPPWQPAPLPVYLTYPYASFYPSRLLRFVSTMREAVPAMITSPPQA